MLLQPITLEGRAVRLAPMSMDHLDGLYAASQDESIWRWTLQVIRTREDMAAYIQQALDGWQGGRFLPFTTIDTQTKSVVGSTRYDGINPTDRNLEIGWTWIHPRAQRSAINTEAKYLMLRHAFEGMGCIRVQLKTDSLNEKSRAAIARLGAKEEGILCNHMITQGGRYRHSVMFSITDAEWPAVKDSLEARLNRAT